MFVLSLLFLASYLLGAIPFGWLVARGHGIDILKHGSGNIGATNVGRVLGKKYGVIVLLLDFAKGALPVAVAQWLALGFADLPHEAFGVTAGVAAFLGHLFPVYLRFRGGKGVATGAGVVVVLVPLPALAAILLWIVAVVLTRYVSVASIVAAVTICAVQLCTTPQPWSPPHNIVSIFCIVAAGLVVVRHAGNLRRLLHGTENRLKESATMMLFSKTLHVLALGLWFGTVVFMTLAGVLIFEEFDKESKLPAEKRPLWFPLPTEYNKEPPSPTFLKPLSSEQGTLPQEQGVRAAGIAVSPLFPWYYGIQLVCGFIAYGTALSWQKGREKDKVQSWRAWLLMLAVIVTLAGWWLESKVSDLRKLRNEKTDLVLSKKQPAATDIADAIQARKEFGTWHLYSLAQNFVTLGLVTVAMALAAQLPTNGQSAGPSEERKAASDEKTPTTV